MKKVCSKCREEKDLDQFCINRSKKSGLHCYCRQCMAELTRAWHLANRDRVRDVRRKYRAENKDIINAKKRKRYAEEGGHAAVLAEATAYRPDKEEFALASSDDGISLAAAISLLKMKPHMKVLALAIIGAGSGGADCHYLMETVLKRQCYATLKTAIFWLRRHLVGTGMKLESLGYGRGYRIVFEVAA